MEVIDSLRNLNIKEYPKLFIFIIETACKNPAKLETVLCKLLLEYGIFRPILLQITSESERVTKFFYKPENTDEFCEISNSQCKSEIKIDSFEKFLVVFLTKRSEKFMDEIKSQYKSILKIPLILRFLGILKIEDQYMNALLFFSLRDNLNFLTLLDFTGYFV